MGDSQAMEAMRTALTAVCRRALGGSHVVTALERLSGGANMETWALHYGEQALVLRRTPGGRALGDGSFSESALPLADQAELIRRAATAGVSVPAVPAELQPADGLGDGFLMTRVAGEALPRRIIGQPAFAVAEQRLLADCARELARIHAIDARGLQRLEHRPAAVQVADLAARLQASGAPLPVFALALGWLERHLPEPVPPAVVHGDFRFGNFMVDANGIAAVLDWELARLGDPAQDLAYLCTPSWRHGRHDRAVGGFGEVPDLLAAYHAASGRTVSADRLRFWLLFSTLWWGMACLTMVGLWRDGRDRSLERTVVGRRVSEVEVDLLMLLQDLGAVPDAGLLSGPRLTPAPAHGETAVHELLQALSDWAGAVGGAAGDAFRRFEARVAVNALGIAQRQALGGAAFDAARAARLAALGPDEPALAARLRTQGLAPGDVALWDHLRLSTLERLAIDQPRYAGARIARARWCTPEETA